MDQDQRLELQQTSKLSKKIIEIQNHLDDIEKVIDKERLKLTPAAPFSCHDDTDDTIDSLESQMTVCVRARPVLEHEMSPGYISVVHTANPVVLVTEPVLRSVPGASSAQEIRLNTSQFSVDMVFGPEDDNDVVYTNTIQPLLTTAKKVNLNNLEDFLNIFYLGSYVQNLEEVRVEIILKVEKYRKSFRN